MTRTSGKGRPKYSHVRLPGLTQKEYRELLTILAIIPDRVAVDEWLRVQHLMAKQIRAMERWWYRNGEGSEIEEH
jgi:hypothetical protein